MRTTCAQLRMRWETVRSPTAFNQLACETGRAGGLRSAGAHANRRKHGVVLKFVQLKDRQTPEKRLPEVATSNQPPPEEWFGHQKQRGRSSAGALGVGGGWARR